MTVKGINRRNNKIINLERQSANCLAGVAYPPRQTWEDARYTNRVWGRLWLGVTQ